MDLCALANLTTRLFEKATKKRATKRGRAGRNCSSNFHRISVIPSGVEESLDNFRRAAVMVSRDVSTSLDMTQAAIVVTASLFGLASQGLSMPPKVVVDDLSHLKMKRVFPTVQSMPQMLQRALAKTFHQPKLSMANPTENLRNEITPG